MPSQRRRPSRRAAKDAPRHVSGRTARAGAKAKSAAPRAGGTAKTRLYDATAVRKLAREVARWEASTLAPVIAKTPLRQRAFATDSGVAIPPVLTAADRRNEVGEQLGLPGEFPFTRGVQPTMYRGRLWTMRMFAGFGSPEDTNQRFKYLMAHGTTGLSTAFDMPALMGYDADHSMSRGEVGKEGVAVSSLRDFEVLFDGIPLDKVTTSMTINASAIVALCMYVAVGEQQGIPMAQLGGTIQNDMLKEYIAQKEWIVPPRPAVRIVVDMIEYLQPAHAPLARGIHQRLPHPGGGGDGGPGAGLHAGGRHWLRRGVRQARPRRGRFRSSLVVLLGRPQRLLRGGCEVPRRPPHLGPRDAGALRGPRPAQSPAAHPRADGRCERSPPSSPTTTSSGPRFRLWQPFSGARSRCTPTRWMRPMRFPPKTP